MLCAFGHYVATCCCMVLKMELVCMAGGNIVAWKIWPFSNLSQQHPTCRNTLQQGGQTRATCCARQCWDMLRWNVAIAWPGLKTRELWSSHAGRPLPKVHFGIVAHAFVGQYFSKQLYWYKVPDKPFTFSSLLTRTYILFTEGTYEDHYHITYPERVDGSRDRRDLSTSYKVNNCFDLLPRSR